MTGPFLTLELPDAAATATLGRRLAPRLRAGDLLALHGDLGAGKTTLARALIHALPGPPGSAEEAVPSPTFTLLQLYEREVATVWHFDLYRLRAAGEVWELGWEEALAGGLVLVEWPERLGDLLPAGALSITLSAASGENRRENGGEKGGGDDPGRRVAFAGDAPWPDRLGDLSLDG